MRVGVCGGTPLERIARAVNLVPVPFAESMLTMLLARALMAACKLGLFEALAAAPLSAGEVAERAGTDTFATRKLLDALVASRYLRYAGERYALAPVARKWLLAESPTSLRDNLLFRYLEWDLLSKTEEFVRSGRRADIHAHLDETSWELYQRGMRSLAGFAADEVARRLRLPREAARMLDIGGSHGLYSVRLCQRHPALRSTILDLPDAVRHAAPILAREGMGDRVVHRAGDALRDDLGHEAYDLVFVSSLVHHFDEATNRALACRIARALKPDGLFAVLEPLRPSTPGEGGQFGTLLDLFFGMTSGSGAWSAAEMQSWQRGAGLDVLPLVRLRLVRGAALVLAVRR